MTMSSKWRRRAWLAAPAFVLAACSTPSTPPKLVIAVGDSITAGYMAVDGVVQLRQDLAYPSRWGSGWRVVNVAIPGYTTLQSTDWPIQTTRRLVPQATVVMLGTNDALKSLPMPASQAAMKTILDAFPAGRLIIVTPPFSGEPQRAWHEQWNGFLRSEATARQAAFVDAYTPSVGADWQCALPDIHICANGHAAIAALVKAELDQVQP